MPDELFKARNSQRRKSPMVAREVNLADIRRQDPHTEFLAVAADCVIAGPADKNAFMRDGALFDPNALSNKFVQGSLLLL